MNIAREDILLWESFRKGDRDAFASLFRAYYQPLLRYGSKFTMDDKLLEDCIQELFIELWQSNSRTEVLSVKSYLLKSLKYKILKTYRKKTGRLSPTDGGDHFIWSHENFLIAEQENEEKRQSLLRALEKLSNRQKEIIYLKYYQNLSYEEVSEIMNINYQVARNLLYQAIKSLKSMLAGAMIFFILLLRLHLFPF